MTSCPMKAYYFCPVCTVDNRRPKAYCGIRTGRDCFAKHVKDIYTTDVHADTPVANITPASRRRRSPRSRS
jgi:hypothetical protein